MKHSPTLLAIAAIAAVPSAFALNVEDTDLKLGLKAIIQARVEHSDAQTAAGAPYDVIDGASRTNDPLDFYLRRARFGFAGSYKDDYKFTIMVRMDNADKSTTATRAAVTHVAVIERIFKQDDLKLTHSIRAGLDYAFFNSALNWGGNILASGRATESVVAARGVGVGYKLTAPCVLWGVDVQNNTADDAGTGGDGLFYSTRVQISPEGEWKIPAFQETWAGKEGKGALLAAEYGANTRSNDTDTTTAMGVEALVHYDGLSAHAEFRRATFTEHDTDAETKGQFVILTAGYALPLGSTGTTIEPVARYSIIDLDTDNDAETGSYYTASAFTPTSAASSENGASGTQYDLGVNWYLHGPAHKLQLAFQQWQAEEGDADAQIARAQWHLSF